MTMTLNPTEVFVKPDSPVEVLVSIDGKATRVAIEWPLIERMMGRASPDEQQVREFLRGNREALLVALQSHVMARGIPLNRYLVMTPEDLEAVEAAQRAASEGRAAGEHAS